MVNGFRIAGIYFYFVRVNLINILSIDWDYFIDATDVQRFALFPDSGNEDFAPELQSVVWSLRYMATHKLADISVMNGELGSLFQLISDFKKPDTQLYVYESHKNLYDVVRKFKKDGRDVNIFNIDFHHDCNNFGGNKVDCGNWFRWLIKKGMVNKAVWIRREDSFYDDLTVTFDIHSELRVLCDYLQSGIDSIFVCRSSMWSPPHLDGDFNDMVNAILLLLGLVKPTKSPPMFQRWQSI